MLVDTSTGWKKALGSPGTRVPDGGELLKVGACN